MTQPLISVLIINWNGERFLGDCLESIRERVTVPCEVVLLDNHSSDGSAELVTSRFPWVKLVRSNDNLGFIKGNNLAAQYATGKFLLLLNNDTVLRTDVRDAVEVLEGDETIGAVGATMYDRQGGIRLSCAHFPTPARLWRFASIWYVPTDSYAGPGGIALRRCDFVEGSFLLTRAEDWRRVGGLDERNYMYGDDFDYCRSLLDLGLTTVQCPSVGYTHFGGYNHARMGYLFAGFRRYHRKFSSRIVQWQAEFVLRTGLWLRLPWYWIRAAIKKDPESRSALKHALLLNRNWSQTLIDAHRFH